MLTASVGVMAYNEEQNIGKLLAALKGQSLENVEIRQIIVVSSGSTDRTDDIVAGCPCVPPCSAKFHEDVFANMNCWSALLAGGYDKCPGCGRPIPGIAARAAQPSSDSSN